MTFFFSFIFLCSRAFCRICSKYRLMSHKQFGYESTGCFWTCATVVSIIWNRLVFYINHRANPVTLGQISQFSHIIVSRLRRGLTISPRTTCTLIITSFTPTFHSDREIWIDAKNDGIWPQKKKKNNTARSAHYYYGQFLTV